MEIDSLIILANPRKVIRYQRYLNELRRKSKREVSKIGRSLRWHLRTSAQAGKKLAKKIVFYFFEKIEEIAERIIIPFSKILYYKLGLKESEKRYLGRLYQLYPRTR
ncbi:hypothetical protein A2997_01345 [Candidatus Nomurabacteria bacterium RIFCSPLOWO2_01_FULL_36_10b]|uniref:Uncharacterized protein n=1 Tax=Candidatus Nomurabacteria bacterium RIFCSPLOWO2_01_FULL_36_10b TaxID=1801766 RepID=A0A1F6WQH5_9BACT|nr:MAG: hypothetical protein A2997_01345 [Candidatus Nomurabacteria bacterium RIFCSPLOWO2_01_FULL_36_10b]